MNPKLRIAYLADHPEVIPIIKEWFEAEWQSYYGATGPGNALSDLHSYANRHELSIGLVAFYENEPCGMAALKSDSFATHRHAGPWAAAGFVKPSHRRKGIGAELVHALEDLARTLGYKQIYCGTSTANHLLERRNWQFIERIQHEGERVSIYQKPL